MDFTQWLMDALKSGFTMDEKGDLYGTQANWTLMALNRQQEDEFKKFNDDWMTSRF